MPLIDAITVASNAPAHFADRAAWYRWVPQQVRVAYWRAIQPNSLDGGASLEQEALLSPYPPGISLADVRARVPHAFADAEPYAGADPVLRAWGDVFRALSDDQINLLFFFLSAGTGNDAHPVAKAARQALDASSWNEKRSDVLRYLRFHIAHGGYGTRPGGVRIGAATAVPLATERELGSLNRALAGKWADSMLAPGPAYTARRQALRAYAIGVGGNPAASDVQLAAVAAAVLSEAATARAIAIDDAIEAQKQQGAAFEAEALVGSAIAIEPAGVAGTAGLDDSFRKLVRHPLKWVRGVLKEVGKGAGHAADLILDAEKDAPWLSQFLLKPLGFHLQASVLKQLGAVLIDGSVNAFDERAVVIDAGQTFQAAGQALAVAAPFLPAPWNVAAAALAAISIVAGTAILKYARDQEAIRQLAKIEAAADAAARDAQAEQEAIAAETRELVLAAEAPAARSRAPLYAAAAGIGLAALIALTHFAR